MYVDDKCMVVTKLFQMSAVIAPKPDLNAINRRHFSKLASCELSAVCYLFYYCYFDRIRLWSPNAQVTQNVLFTLSV